MIAKAFLTNIRYASLRAAFSVKNHVYNWNKDDYGFNAKFDVKGQNLPVDGQKTQYMETSEIEARILRVCSHFEKIDIQKLNWQGDIQKDLGLDSLERVALITSIEHEFRTLWEDRVFDQLHNLRQIVNELHKDPMIY